MASPPDPSSPQPIKLSSHGANEMQGWLCGGGWDGFGSWWLNTETKWQQISGLSPLQVTSLALPLALSLPHPALVTQASSLLLPPGRHAPSWGLGTLWCSSPRSPDGLLFPFFGLCTGLPWPLHLTLHCFYLLVLPPDCSVALRKIWHITVLFTVYLPLTRMSVLWQHRCLFSLFDALSPWLRTVPGTQ